MPGKPFLISSLVKGRKPVVCEKEKVFPLKKNRQIQTIFRHQNLIFMAKGKKYTWTISVIAIYDENEDPLKKGYIEFEESIRSLQNPNKDIRFVIFLYNTNSEVAEVRISVIRDGRIHFEKKPLGKVDIYEETHDELKRFFKEFVARKELEADEEHKHIVLTWGHGAGLGFMKKEIKEKLQKLQAANLGDEKDDKQGEINNLGENIYAFNTLSAHLSFDRRNDFHQGLKERLLNKGSVLSTLAEKEDKRTELEKLFRVITAFEFAGILNDGLENDKSTVSVDGSDKPIPAGIKVQVMICLTCYVNMIETAFSFKNIVNVYVAPQTEISFYGYNYKELFKLLCDSPQVNERDISVNITHNYLNKYLDPLIKKDILGRSLFSIDYKNGVAFSAIYLKYCDSIAAKVRKFKEFIFKKAQLQIVNKGLTVEQILINARRKCLSLSKMGASDIGIIDYQNYITEVLGYFDRVHRDEFERFFSFDFVISDYCPGSMCRSQYIIGAHDFISLSPGSFSIFLPDKPVSDIEKELSLIYIRMSKEPGNFLSSSEWDFFIGVLNS
jgi:hypothetical protein